MYRRFEKHNFVLSFIHCHGICVYIVLSLLIARLAIILPAEGKGIKEDFSYNKRIQALWCSGLVLLRRAENIVHRILNIWISNLNFHYFLQFTVGKPEL